MGLVRPRPAKHVRRASKCCVVSLDEVGGQWGSEDKQQVPPTLVAHDSSPAAQAIDKGTAPDAYATLRKLFNTCDLQHDGAVSKGELLRMLRIEYAGVVVDSAPLLQLFSSCGASGGDSLRFDEFIALAPRLAPILGLSLVSSSAEAKDGTVSGEDPATAMREHMAPKTTDFMAAVRVSKPHRVLVKRMWKAAKFSYHQSGRWTLLEYMDYHLSVFLHLTRNDDAVQPSDGSFDVDEAWCTACADWESDVRDCAKYDFTLFSESVFELADMHVPQEDFLLYKDFLQALVDGTTCTLDEKSRQRRWRHSWPRQACLDEIAAVVATLRSSLNIQPSEPDSRAYRWQTKTIGSAFEQWCDAAGVEHEPAGDSDDAAEEEGGRSEKSGDASSNGQSPPRRISSPGDFRAVMKACLPADLAARLEPLPKLLAVMRYFDRDMDGRVSPEDCATALQQELAPNLASRRQANKPFPPSKSKLASPSSAPRSGASPVSRKAQYGGDAKATGTASSPPATPPPPTAIHAGSFDAVDDRQPSGPTKTGAASAMDRALVVVAEKERAVASASTLPIDKTFVAFVNRQLDGGSAAPRGSGKFERSTCLARTA